jgi:ABC-2 type transport system permease protein
MYVMNTGFGVIMMLIAAIALKTGGIGPLFTALEISSEFYHIAGTIFAFVLSLMVMTINVTGSSISLEGRNVWLLKIIPQPASRILSAKALLNFMMTVPAAIISIVLVAMTLPLSAANLALLILMPLLSAVFITLFGLIVNLKSHKFDWISEMSVVKRSPGAMIPLFTGMILIIIPMYLMFTMPGVAFEWIAAGLIAVLDAAMIAWLKKHADALVRAL